MKKGFLQPICTIETIFVVGAVKCECHYYNAKLNPLDLTDFATSSDMCKHICCDHLLSSHAVFDGKRLECSTLPSFESDSQDNVRVKLVFHTMSTEGF